MADRLRHHQVVREKIMPSDNAQTEHHIEDRLFMSTPLG